MSCHKWHISLSDHLKWPTAQCKTKDVLTTHRIRSSLNHHDWMFHFIYKSSFDSLTKLIRNLIHCTQWKHRKKLVDLSKQAGVCKWRNLPGTARNQPEPPQPPGTNRNPPEPTRNLEKSANDKIKKKKQITKNNTNQIKIMKMK